MNDTPTDSDARAKSQLQSVFDERDLAFANHERAQAAVLASADRVARHLMSPTHQSSPPRIVAAKLASARVEHEHQLQDLAAALVLKIQTQTHLDFILAALERSALPETNGDDNDYELA